MKKCLLLVLSYMFFCVFGQAQPKASFTTDLYNSNSTCTGIPRSVTFTNTSTGSISVLWNFGDGSQSTAFKFPVTHTYTSAGVYMVTLIAEDANGSADTATQAIPINSINLAYTKTPVFLNSCNRIAYQYAIKAETAVPDSLSYSWQITGGYPGYLITSKQSSVIDSFITPAQTHVYATVTSQAGNFCEVRDDSGIATVSPILPTRGADSLIANRQCVDDDNNGWINYYFDNQTPADYTDDTLLLSIYPSGQDIGNIGDGTFSIKVVATAGAGSNSAVFVNNPALWNKPGFWVMNRYWSVTPTHQPSQPVGVRFYFTNQDFNDVKASYNYPSSNIQIDDLFFYNTFNGNPDPVTNLAGVNSLVILSGRAANGLGTLTNWADFGFLSDKHKAEFEVTTLSGGSGGIYAATDVLPVQLTSFTANNNGNKVSLQWTTAQEINVSKYNVQVSADGRQFTTLGTVAAHGKTTADAYTFSYNETKLAQAYYRLQIVEKNGTVSGSQVIPLSFFRANNIITLYPNPAKNSVQVKAVGFENKQVTAVIYNAAGMKITTTSLYFANGVATLNTASLASGHYTITVRDEQSVMHLPLVIVK